MPQAEQWLRDKMVDRFGSIDAGAPLEFLLKAGFTEEGGYIHLPSKYRFLSQIPDPEWDCILFLVHEWDFDVDPSSYEKEPSNVESSSNSGHQEGAGNEAASTETSGELAPQTGEDVGD